jgi:hypothetical protein
VFCETHRQEYLKVCDNPDALHDFWLRLEGKKKECYFSGCSELAVGNGTYALCKTHSKEAAKIADFETEQEADEAWIDFWNRAAGKKVVQRVVHYTISSCRACPLIQEHSGWASHYYECPIFGSSSVELGGDSIVDLELSEWFQKCTRWEKA